MGMMDEESHQYVDLEALARVGGLRFPDLRFAAPDGGIGLGEVGLDL